jgi:hypothetical protein
VFRKAVFCAVLFPALLPSQRPAMPGKLNVTSTPAGVKITMDQAATNRYTPALFVVSAGNHTVALAGGACGVGKVDVDPGSTWTVNCDKSGWHMDRKAK